MFKSVLLLVLTLALCKAAPYHLKHKHESNDSVVAIADISGVVKNKTSGLESHVSGTVEFIQDSPKGLMRVHINVSFVPDFDLGRNVTRGIHIHVNQITNNTGNPTIDCGTAGPHWNPENMTHGLLKSKERHYGDLGNVLTEDGRIFVVIEQLNLSFEGKNSVLNRSVVLHERLDDGGLGTDPTSKTAGNSGGRIACGTIRLKN